jgi:phage minor structural protein
VVGNKLSFSYDKDYYFNIVHVERSETELYVEAYSLSFELLNEKIEDYSASEAMTFVQYLAVIDPEKTLTRGINEVSDKCLLCEWTGESTVLARLFSLANFFSAEIEFAPVLNDDYSLKEIVINVYREHSDAYQGIGKNQTFRTLRYGEAISGITKKSDITDLYTCICLTGNNGLQVSDLDKTEYDSNGAVEYRSAPGDCFIRAVQARDRFPSNLMNKNDRYIACYGTYDTDNVNVLYGEALALLKKNCTPQVEYEVSGYIDAGIGDTFSIEDSEFKPVLYLEARISEQVRSFNDVSKNKTTFSNFKEIQSQISSVLITKMQEMIDASKPYACTIYSDNGIVFKNGAGTTSLYASVMDVGRDMTFFCSIIWYKDGVKVGEGRSLAVSSTDITSKSVYKFEAYSADGTMRGFYEVTVSNVYDGADGIQGPAGADGTTYYTWLKYADSPTTGMSDDPTGKAYFGIAYNRVSPTESTTYSDYNWSLIKGEKGDTGVPGGVGADGKTYYTWIKYAAGSTGSDMSDDPTGKSYIGIAYNKETVTESSNPSDYTWSLIKGDTGRGVESITKQYYLSTSSSTPTGGVWQTNIPTWSKGTYLWERSVIVYNNPTETVNADPVINADWGDANSNIYDVQQKVTESGIVTLINESLASGNQISATKFVMDALGLLIKGGGLTIENNAGTVVLSADSDGNLTFSGQLSGATGTFKGLFTAYNSNGKRLMQVSEGSVKFYDGTDNETVQGSIDSDLGSNVANLRLTGASMISFQAGANTLMSMSPNRMMVYKPIGIGGGYKNYPKTYGSSIIQTVSNTDAVALITSSTINYYLGVSDSGQGNTAVFACNGDGGAASVHVNSTTYLNGTWYVTLASTFSGTIRINYVVCYFDN